MFCLDLHIHCQMESLKQGKTKRVFYQSFRIKQVLNKGNIKDQISMLSEIDFSQDWNQLLSKDELKLIAFRVGQALALIQGI